MIDHIKKTILFHSCPGEKGGESGRGKEEKAWPQKRSGGTFRVATPFIHLNPNRAAARKEGKTRKEISLD